MKLNLHSALTNSYKKPKDAAFNMLKNGYEQDSSLSNDNQQVYFNAKDKKLLVSVAGTHNIRDWGTDLWLGLGGLKNTNRYKEADSILKKAKEKYKVPNATVIGHSLGGSIASNIASKAGGDKAITLDAGYTIGQKTRGDSYRAQGDAVSLLGANAKHQKTINHGNILTRNRGAILGGLLGGPAGLAIGAIADGVRNHNVDIVKDKKIFI